MNWNFSQIRLQSWKFFKFLTNFSCRSQNFTFLFKVGSKELNHAATGDLKNGGRGVKGGLDRRTYPYQLFRWIPPQVFTHHRLCVRWSVCVPGRGAILWGKHTKDLLGYWMCSYVYPQWLVGTVTSFLSFTTVDWFVLWPLVKTLYSLYSLSYTSFKDSCHLIG